MTPTQALFNAHNLRCTLQRTALYEALRSCKTHPTAEELFRMVRSHVDRLSLATVYNTLDALCEAGLAKRMPMSNGCCRFDADTSEHLHVKFTDSMEIRDVPTDLGRQLVESLPRDTLRQIEDRMGVRIDGVSIQLVASRAGENASDLC